jgi:uncharacterized protein (DUF1800 family)
MSTEAPRVTVAFNRFGLGPRRGDLAKITDPRAAVIAELAAPEGAAIADEALLRTPVALQTV